jgi:hypothetical protein
VIVDNQDLHGSTVNGSFAEYALADLGSLTFSNKPGEGFAVTAVLPCAPRREYPVLICDWQSVSQTRAAVLASAAGRMQPRNADPVALFDATQAWPKGSHVTDTFVDRNKGRLWFHWPVSLWRHANRCGRRREIR